MISNLFFRLKRKVERILNQKTAYDYPEESGGWHKLNENPVLNGKKNGSLFDPFVRKVDGSFIMCISQRSNHSLKFCRSSDGINWDEGIEVLNGLDSSDWETEVNRGCFLIHEKKWMLWYTGQHEGKSSIGLAVSEDGIHFKRNNKPVLWPEYFYEATAVMNPCVMWDEKRSVFRMWYAAGENYEPDVICYAESEDGYKWRKKEGPIMKADITKPYKQDKVGACDVVQLSDGRYCMAYIAYQNVNVARIALAYSENGIDNWKDSTFNPIISPSRGKWDGHAVYKPSLIIDEHLKEEFIWYNGRLGHCEQIGMAYRRMNQ